MAEREKELVNCKNFRLELLYEKPKGTVGEIQHCSILGEVSCNGWSDGCLNPAVFNPKRDIPRENIDFDSKMPRPFTWEDYPSQ